MTDKAPTNFAPGGRKSRSGVVGEHARLAGHVCSSYFDFFPLPLVVLNAQRQIVYSNQAFYESLGTDELDSFLSLRPGEAMGCVYASEGESGCGTSKYCRECGALRAVLETIAGNLKSTHDCQLLLKKNGETAARDLRVFAAPWQPAKEAYYVVSIMDVGDEKRRRVLERVFFHDILNIAGGARGLAELLHEEGPEETREQTGIIRSALFSLVEEIQRHRELLDLENGRYALSLITLRAHEVLAAVVAEYGAHPSAWGRKILFDPGSPSLSVLTDHALLRRVLGNMIVNALEATAAGGAVRAGVLAETGKAVFWVANDKVMPESVKLQIFKRSFSTKGKDRGLGTYSIKLFTENYLKGEAGFNSAEGEGTVFWVKLPLAA
ncbi:MAG: sensor histidine kinase, partial [Thermodesulfobacteriota bacterium]